MQSSAALPRASFGTNGPTTPCSRRPLFMRCTCGSSTNGRSIGRIERISLVSLRRSCAGSWSRSEEHTSELQSLRHIVCRLLLEKKDKLIAIVRRDRVLSIVTHINAPCIFADPHRLYDLVLTGIDDTHHPQIAIGCGQLTPDVRH